MYAKALSTLVATLLLTASAHGEVASIYGGKDGLCGSRTASGERFNCGALTAAHKTLPLGSHVRVSHGGKSVVVRINDRGPYVKGRSIDLSPAAAHAIGCDGLCEVLIEVER